MVDPDRTRTIAEMTEQLEDASMRRELYRLKQELDRVNHSRYQLLVDYGRLMTKYEKATAGIEAMELKLLDQQTTMQRTLGRMLKQTLFPSNPKT